MTHRTQVLVAGAGIAGLAAALGLARMGREVVVLERAEALAEVGAGLQISPNALRALDFLGVGPQTRAAGMRPEAAELRLHDSGRRVFRLPLGEAAEARWGAPYLHLHRADLHGILHAAALSAGVRVIPGEPVQALERPGAPEGETARLRTDRHEWEADLILGADGVRSTLREAVAGASKPLFSHNIAWRGLVPVEGLPDAITARRATVWMGIRRHLVTYPLRGGSVVNFIAVEERPDWTAEGWSKPGDPRALRAGFAGWAPPVAKLLERVEETFLWGLFGHAPLPRWSLGRTALLGDAAHPTTPFLAQGAAMGLEDAATLCRALETWPQAQALARWEALRKPRATRLQAASARTGRNYHAANRAEQWVKATALAAFAALAPSRAQSLNGWLYSHDPAAPLSP